MFIDTEVKQLLKLTTFPRGMSTCHWEQRVSQPQKEKLLRSKCILDQNVTKQRQPGNRFLKVPEIFRVQKAI